ncbi:MAG: leucyl aminopeptidase [candidate division Zixibacteria bacterium]|nr:leucyl aminopeptidase [candidate division Zixibacteria bacterium]
MEFTSYTSNFLDIAEEASVMFCFKNEKSNSSLLEKIDILTDGTVFKMYKSGEFSGDAGDIVMLRHVPETASGKVILAGLGDEKSVTLDDFRKAAGRIGKLALSHKIRSIGFYYDGNEVNPRTSAIVEGFVLGSYKYLNYKTDEKSKNTGIDSMAIVVPRKNQLRQAEVGLARGEIISESVCNCRDLVNLPGNALYPESYAKEAAKLAKKYKFKCRILNESDIKKEKMGALLSVSQGSDKGPRFVVLEYNGKAKAKPVVLIGKGVTFDSGGISLKPGLNMGEMKGDMTGSAVVLNVITAAARLQAKINLVVLMPLVENMPSGKATRPGDIVTSRAGLTIEVINTDAEGRMILADAIDYAKKFDPQAVIDIATLTGAAQYILGYAGAPFVGTNQKLNDNLRQSAELTGERIWELPLWEDFTKIMKSPIADLHNSGGRQAGTLTAASFLKQFTGDWPWAHIDIAYCDVEPKGLPYIPVGPTGFGVRLLLETIMRWKKVS